ncbi:hypothetical protein JZ751_013782 [Albula glossodonta]|uniref:Uncharacterized protein n=1 Tax=Albula glossodonta TaxID=121402 RepID=A0A8T2P1V1_9TELE|nr:hypothetical protein JZ751_013782 [Albula glossodonta]
MALSVAERAVGAIVGAAVADAAANPFYRRDTGQQSCYGDQAYVLLESLAECGGLNVEDLKKRTLKAFGPGSEYDTPVNDPYREKGGPRPQLPIEGPWRHASLKSFLKNVDAGKEETGESGR